MLGTLLSKESITAEHFHLKQTISENCWNSVGDVSNLQELFGLYEAREGLIEKLIKEVSKKVIHMFITATTSSLGYIKTEQEIRGRRCFQQGDPVPTNGRFTGYTPPH